MGACSQTYTDVAEDFGITHVYPNDDYGGGVSMADFNNDGWDDLSLCTSTGETAKFYLNDGEGGLDLLNTTIPEGGMIKQMTWVDVDNDGNKELFITRKWDSFELYNFEGGLFVNISDEAGFPDTEFNTYGNSWGDYNKDGYLDVYICNYDIQNDITNILYKNNGDGTFTDVTEEAGVGNGSQWSFQGLWYDYDCDGWQDLFVINDREPATNHLYHNEGDGTFDDVTWAVGLNDYFFSMCATGADFDNDQDVDLYVTNNPFGHRLYEYNDGTYTNVAVETGTVTYDHGWASIWMDWDNNGWQDLYVSCSPFWTEPGANKFFESQAEGTFFLSNTSMGIYDPGSSSHSAAVGDINNDGLFDLFVVNDWPDVSYLYESSGGVNNYLKVKLTGTVSNKDAIGATITCYTEDLTQMRTTYCGESYLSQNSNTEIFGLNQYNVVDSLHVKWPSGIEEIFYDLAVNGIVSLTEGATLEGSLSLFGPQPACPSDTVILQANPALQDIVWSNGYEGETLEVTAPGIYYYSANSPVGGQVVSPEIDVFYLQEPEFDVDLINVTCYGQDDGLISLELLSGSVSDSIHWNTENSDLLLSNISAGTYDLTYFFGGSCLYEETFEIEEPDSLEIVIQVSHVSCYGYSDGWVNFVGIGGIEPYDIDGPNEGEQDLPAGTYTASITDANSCITEAEFIVQQPDSIAGNILVQDCLCYGSIDGEVIWNPDGEFPPFQVEFSSDPPDQLVAGSYEVTITDSEGCVAEWAVEVSQPDELTGDPIVIDANTEEGGSASLDLSGGTLPYNILWDGSELGPEVYDLEPGDHFVDVVDGNGCELHIDFSVGFTSVTEHGQFDFHVYPNPSTGEFVISSENSILNVRVVDKLGRTIRLEEFLLSEQRKATIRLASNTAPGIYSVIIASTSGIQTVKRIIIIDG